MLTNYKSTDRPAILDIEASGFGSSSYPIEVGVVLESGETYCSLIIPLPDWIFWDDKAELIHGISRDTLYSYGNRVSSVANSLNSLLTGKTIYSDGWVVDKPWLIKLFHAAKINPLFTLSPLELILSEPQMLHWHTTKDKVTRDTQLTRHRASADARIIQETYVQTLKHKHA